MRGAELRAHNALEKLQTVHFVLNENTVAVQDLIEERHDLLRGKLLIVNALNQMRRRWRRIFFAPDDEWRQQARALSDRLQEVNYRIVEMAEHLVRLDKLEPMLKRGEPDAVLGWRVLEAAKNEVVKNGTLLGNGPLELKEQLGLFVYLLKDLDQMSLLGLNERRLVVQLSNQIVQLVVHRQKKFVLCEL